MSVTSPTLRFLPGAELLLEELDEPDELLELLELPELLELLPQAARTRASATAPTAACAKYLNRAFTGLLSGRTKAQR